MDEDGLRGGGGGTNRSSLERTNLSTLERRTARLPHTVPGAGEIPGPFSSGEMDLSVNESHYTNASH